MYITVMLCLVWFVVCLFSLLFVCFLCILVRCLLFDALCLCIVLIGFRCALLVLC